MRAQLMCQRSSVDLMPPGNGAPTRSEIAEMRAAIAAMLFEDPRVLDIRLLWTGDATTCFRVNWWSAVENGGTRIRRSAFIRVTHLKHGYHVREQAPRVSA